MHSTNFMFELNPSETKNLRSQIDTSSWDNTKLIFDYLKELLNPHSAQMRKIGFKHSKDERCATIKLLTNEIPRN